MSNSWMCHYSKQRVMLKLGVKQMSRMVEILFHVPSIYHCYSELGPIKLHGGCRANLGM